MGPVWRFKIKDVIGFMGAMEQLREEQAEAERLKRRRMRSIAIAVGLVLLVILFYAATIVHLGGNAMRRPF